MCKWRSECLWGSLNRCRAHQGPVDIYNNVVSTECRVIKRCRAQHLVVSWLHLALGGATQRHGLPAAHLPVAMVKKYKLAQLEAEL